MSATKECPSCGAQNDVIFTNCIFCKTALPTNDVNSITNDELVMKASEWVGKSSTPILVIQSSNANEWTGKGIVRMMNAEIVANAEKYLNLLEIRATSNPTLKVTHEGLRDKLEKNSKSLSKKKVRTLGGFILAVVILGFIISIGASFENDAANAYQEKLDKIESQIDEAIKEKNYDYALILIEKIVWNHELNLLENQKKLNHTIEKERNLKKLY